MEQATVNLFAEMGAQPGSLIAGLVAASAVDRHDAADLDDHLAGGGRNAPGRQPGHDLRHRDRDAGGGVVAGVEVSTDNGSTWHPATLTTPAEQSVNWSYTWAAHGNPSDDHQIARGRRQRQPGDPLAPASTVNVSCPCSIWGAAVTPPTPDAGDAHPLELGVKFTSEVFGTVTGVRFYKSTANTGTHIGSLWSTSGQRSRRRRSRTRRRRAGSRSTSRRPSRSMPNTTYIACATSHPAGHYAATQNYFYSPPGDGRQRPEQPAPARRPSEQLRPRTACTRTARKASSPEQLQGDQLLGRPGVHAGRDTRGR